MCSNFLPAAWSEIVPHPYFSPVVSAHMQGVHRGLLYQE